MERGSCVFVIGLRFELSSYVYRGGGEEGLRCVGFGFGLVLYECGVRVSFGVDREGEMICGARVNCSARSWEGGLGFGQDGRLAHRSQAILALSASFLAVMAMPSPDPRPWLPSGGPSSLLPISASLLSFSYRSPVSFSSC